MTLARGTDHIETTRLVLRRIVRDDLPFFTRIHADPDVARYLGHGRPRTPEETSAWLEGTLESYEKHGLGPLAVVRKSDGALLGRSGMSDLAVESYPAPGAAPRAWFLRATAPAGIDLTFERELGYTFDRPHWGQGYASEAAGGVFEYARDTLALSRVISIIHPDNARSQRVAGRFGLELRSRVELMGLPYDLYTWPLPGAPKS